MTITCFFPGAASRSGEASYRTHQTEQTYAPQNEAGILTNPPLWSRRPNHKACSTKMPLSQGYKRCVACQHSHDDQTPRLQAGAGEDGFIHIPSGPDHVVCERQEEEEHLRVAGRPIHLLFSCALHCQSVSSVIARHFAVEGNPLQVTAWLTQRETTAADRSLSSVSLFDWRACRMDKATVRRTTL